MYRWSENFYINPSEIVSLEMVNDGIEIRLTDQRKRRMLFNENMSPEECKIEFRRRVKEINLSSQIEKKIHAMDIKISNLLTLIELQQEKLHWLNDAIVYQPGGEEYHKSRDHFTKLQQVQEQEYEQSEKYMV
jgi:hypothetical protein